MPPSSFPMAWTPKKLFPQFGRLHSTTKNMSNATWAAEIARKNAIDRHYFYFFKAPISRLAICTLGKRLRYNATYWLNRDNVFMFKFIVHTSGKPANSVVSSFPLLLLPSNMRSRPHQLPSQMLGSSCKPSESWPIVLLWWRHFWMSSQCMQWIGPRSQWDQRVIGFP
jgi:hypothetical protein